MTEPISGTDPDCLAWIMSDSYLDPAELDKVAKVPMAEIAEYEAGETSPG